MRRIGLVFLLLASLFLPTAGGATMLLPHELEHGGLVPPERLTGAFRGVEVFDLPVADDRFGRLIFFWLHGGGNHDIGAGSHDPGFDDVAIDIRQCFDRRSFTPSVPKPIAAVAFGIGAVMVAAAVRRR